MFCGDKKKKKKKKRYQRSKDARNKDALHHSSPQGQLRYGGGTVTLPANRQGRRPSYGPTRVTSHPRRLARERGIFYSGNHLHERPPFR